MSAATGLGLLEIAILEACEHGGAGNDAPYLKTQRVLDVLCERTGIAPGHAYEPLCDMARTWAAHLALIDFHGNCGTPDFGPASPRHTECRLSRLGAGALAAERHTIGPLPIGLINGDIYADGPHPPFDPTRVIRAIRAALNVSDEDVSAIVGLPSFPTGCLVSGDIDELACGSETRLRLTAEITELSGDQLLISHLPPGSSASEIANHIQSRLRVPRRFLDDPNSYTASAGHMEIPRIRDVNDRSLGLDETRLLVTLEQGADLVHARAFLGDIRGMKRTITVQLHQPLAVTIRTFTHGTTANISERLAMIESAIKA